MMMGIAKVAVAWGRRSDAPQKIPSSTGVCQCGRGIGVMDKHSTVFVVDDDAKLRESVVALVRGKGVRAEEFSSVGEFLAQHDPTRKGIVVVDVGIEGKSGWDLLRKLKGGKAFVPVVASARNADIPLAVQTMREGAVAFLEKPVAEDDLWESITDALKIEQSQHPQRKE